MPVEEYDLSITTTGSAGSATGNATTSGLPRGKILAVYAGTGMPATADWTFSYPAPASIPLFVLTNFQSGWAVPKLPVYQGGAAVANVGDSVVVNREVNVAIAQGDAATVVLKFLIERQ